MGSDFLDFWSLVSVEGNHSGKQIFEIFRKIIDGSSPGMGFPKHVALLFLDQLVIRVVWHGLLERRVSCIHDEENDSGRENIGFGSIVVFIWNFRGHVSLGAQLGVQNSSSVFSLDQA
jgi:hypothetical protein